MKSPRGILYLSACVLLVSGLISCGGGGGSGGGGSPGNGSTINATGTWEGIYTINYSGGGAHQTNVVMTISQTGTSISGTYSTSSGCTGTINGSVSGSTLSISTTSSLCSDSSTGTGTYSNGQINFNGSGTTSSENYTYYGILYKR